MRTLVENVKFENGKLYHYWVAFTPKHTVKFDTVLKDVCRLQNKMAFDIAERYIIYAERV